VVQVFDFYQAESAQQIAAIRELFLEYAQSLGFSLCFQSFDKELETLPDDYAPPEGRLLLAMWESQPAGCVALHKLDLEICEMKRLYVRPEFRSKGLGKILAAHHRGGEANRLQAITPGYGRACHAHSSRDVSDIRLSRNCALSPESDSRRALHGNQFVMKVNL